MHVKQKKTFATTILAALTFVSVQAAAETSSASSASRFAPVSPVEVPCVQRGPNGEGCTDPRGLSKGRDKITARGKPLADGCKKTNTTKECRDYVLGNKKPPVRDK